MDFDFDFLGEDLTDEELVRKLGMIYEEILSQRKDENFVVNKVQMDKLIKVLNFFLKKEKSETENDIKDNIRVQPVNLRPKEEHGYVTLSFEVFSLNGNDEVVEFCEVLKNVSAFVINADVEGRLWMEITIPYVFVPVR